MAQQGIQPNQEKLGCSICLDPLKDPVTIPCGHNYCMSCIKSYWDDEGRKAHSCPQCRQTFTPRPVLVKNTMLADLVEEMKKMEQIGLKAAAADLCFAGPTDVACDFCIGRKRKATKSCLQCQVSSCELHLRPHYEVAPLKKHRLVETTSNIQENVCSRHGVVMKIFCRTDQLYICYLCLMNEHKGHETVSAEAEMAERQKEFGARWQNVQQRIQDREKDVTMLQDELEAINRSADKAVKSNEKIFSELIRDIRRRSSDVKQQIKSRQRSEVNRLKELQKKLQQEVVELRKKDAELEQLSLSQDHNVVFRNYPLLPESGDSPSTEVCTLQYFENVTAAVSGVRDKLQSVLSAEWTKISVMKAQVDVLSPQAEPRNRSEFLQRSQQITLDVNTANNEVSLSEGNRKATNMEVFQLYPSHADRFTDMFQVLSKESLSRCCYWEVEWSGGGVSVAVAYKDINRAGHESGFGNNDKSWAFECSFNGKYYTKHKKVCTSISGPQCSRVGVYLDHRAGTLSFYRVSESMTLLHRVQTTFTQPLYAGLSVSYFGSTAEVCKLK